MSTFTIKHDTRDNSLSLLTKKELVEAINTARPNEEFASIKESKDDLVFRAGIIRNDLRAINDREVIAAAVVREEQLVIDNQHPRFRYAVKAIVNKLLELAASADEKVAAAMDSLQKDVRRNLSWQFQTLALESGNAAYFSEAATKVDELAQNKTLAEVQAMFKGMEEYWMDRVLSRGFSHSTNQASNLCEEQEFETIRRMAKLFKRINETFADDLSRGADDSYRCDYIGFCL